MLLWPLHMSEVVDCHHLQGMAGHVLPSLARIGQPGGLPNPAYLRAADDSLHPCFHFLLKVVLLVSSAAPFPPASAFAVFNLVFVVVGVSNHPLCSQTLSGLCTGHSLPGSCGET